MAKMNVINVSSPRYRNGKTMLGTMQLMQDLRDSPNAVVEFPYLECSPEEAERFVAAVARIQKEGHKC